jgi:hypothetical protein
MKTLTKSFLVLALSLSAGSAMAGSGPVLMQFNNANMLSGEYLTVSVLDNGDIRAVRSERSSGINEPAKKPAFDDVIDRLDRDQLDAAKAGVALLKPSMKLRALTKAEKDRLKFCAMDSAVNYTVPGEKFAHGRLVVRQAMGCGLDIGLATRNSLERRAEAAMVKLEKIVDKAVTENYDRIYK